MYRPVQELVIIENIEYNGYMRHKSVSQILARSETFSVNIITYFSIIRHWIIFMIFEIDSLANIVLNSISGTVNRGPYLIGIVIKHYFSASYLMLFIQGVSNILVGLERIKSKRIEKTMDKMNSKVLLIEICSILLSGFVVSINLF
jgi:hypothetical protein